MTIVTLDNFEKEVMQAETPVVVDFWASWCGPCMMLAPVMEALEPEVPGVKFCKVNVDDERDLAMEFQIESIPTLLCVKGGKTVSRPAAADVTPGQMLKKTTFWLYYVWAIAVSAAGLALISQASGVVWEASADQTAASVATIVGLISICNAVGRVLFGGMYDKYGRSLSMQLVNGLFILTSAVLLLAMSRGSVAVVILGFVLGGLAYSGVTPTNSAFCRAYFGPGHYPVNFPLINTNLIFASFGSTVSGALYDAGGSYNSTFFLIIGLAAVGIVCSLAISAIDKKGN